MMSDKKERESEHGKDQDNVTCSVCMKIQIKDEGIGIAKENLDKLFIDFGKLDQPDNNINRQGTGLGLSICKKIIE